MKENQMNEARKQNESTETHKALSVTEHSICLCRDTENQLRKYNSFHYHWSVVRDDAAAAAAVNRVIMLISFSINFCASFFTCRTKYPYRPRNMISNSLLLVLHFVGAAVAVVTVFIFHMFQIIFIVNLFIHLIRHFFI